MQLFLPQNLGFQVTPNDLQMARALQTMYPIPRSAALYPNGLNGLGQEATLACPPQLDCSWTTNNTPWNLYCSNPNADGTCPTPLQTTVTPESNCCEVETSSLCPSGYSLVGYPLVMSATETLPGCVAAWNPATSPALNQSSFPTATPACPTGWTGTYPDCVAPSVLPPTTTYSTPPTTTPPTSVLSTMPTGISTTGSTLASQTGSGATSSTSTSTSSSTSTASWFTDPTQEIISGIPNWGLIAVAGLGLFLMMGKK